MRNPEHIAQQNEAEQKGKPLQTQLFLCANQGQVWSNCQGTPQLVPITQNNIIVSAGFLVNLKTQHHAKRGPGKKVILVLGVASYRLGDE